MDKALILYYSYEGSTERIASFLAENLGADIERVRPVKEMKARGFSKYIWGGSQVVMKKKPDLQPLNVKLEDYSTIIIGSPIWAGTFAPPIYSLFENDLLKNKKIGYFYCHLGGDKNAIAKARQSIEKNNTFISACPCLSVKDNFETEKRKALKWAEDLINQDDKQ